MPSPEPESRPPSPTFPGAWPSSTLCDNSQLSAGDDVDSEKQQKLGFPVSASSSKTLGFDESSFINDIPELQGNSASTLVNLCTAASQTTAVSTLKYDLEEPSNEPDFLTRIHSLPSPERSPGRVRYTQGKNDTTTAQSHRSVSSSSESSTPPSPFASLHSQRSNPASTISTLLFASPTSSNRTPPAIRFSRTARNDAYDYSSFLTSEEGEYDDSNLLRTGTPSAAPSLSPSPFPSPDSATQGVVIVSPMSEVYASSTGDLQVPQVPLLTSLSLPGSLDGDINSVDVHLPSPRATMPLPCLPSELHSGTPHGSPTTTPASLMVASTTSSFTSLSRPSSLQGSPSSPLIFASFPIPAIPDTSSESNNVTEPSPTEYATAIMMSAWGSAPHLEPINVEMQTRPTDTESGTVNDRTSGPVTRKKGPKAQDVANGTSIRERSGVLLFKMKKIGEKIRVLFQADSRRKRDATGHQARRSSHPVQDSENSRIDEATTSADQTSPESELCPSVDGRILSPNSRSQRQRPSLTAETYAPSLHPMDPPVYNDRNIAAAARPRALPQCSAQASENNQGAPDNESHGSKESLEVHSRPKTLSEIKSKRRFSLSTFTDTTSASGPSTPIRVAPPRRTRPRPASALILPSYARSRPEDARARTRASISYPVNPTRVSAVPPPPGLGPPRTRLSPRSTDTPSHTLASSSVRFNEAVVISAPTDTSQIPTTRVPPERRNNQGFSLLTLSSFAAGLREHGSWARFNNRNESGT